MTRTARSISVTTPMSSTPRVAYDDAARRMRDAAVVNLSALSARADSDSSDNEDD